jgi:hypothetical protein
MSPLPTPYPSHLSIHFFLFIFSWLCQSLSSLTSHVFNISLPLFSDSFSSTNLTILSSFFFITQKSFCSFFKTETPIHSYRNPKHPKSDLTAAENGREWIAVCHPRLTIGLVFLNRILTSPTECPPLNGITKNKKREQRLKPGDMLVFTLTELSYDQDSTSTN